MGPGNLTLPCFDKNIFPFHYNVAPLLVGLFFLEEGGGFLKEYFTPKFFSFLRGYVDNLSPRTKMRRYRTICSWTSVVVHRTEFIKAIASTFRA